MEGKNLNEIRFIVASGAWNYGERSLAKPFNPAIFDAITNRTLTLGGERLGNLGINPIKPNGFLKQALWNAEVLKNRKKVLRKIPGGWINRMGWWNVGFDYWRDEIYPKTKEMPKIISIGGFSIEEYLEMIRQLNEKKVTAVELNISCPNVKINWEGDLVLFENLMKQCRAKSKHSLIIKLSIEKDYLQRAKIAEDIGIDAISAINTVKGLMINPKIGEFFYGGISGKRIKEIGLRVVAEIRKTVDMPIFGSGGIYNWKDCQQYFWAGADAVSFGSVFFFQFWKMPWIIKMNKDDVEKIISKRKQKYGC